ncbi:LysR family transcriptional regulator [Arabiibacter massiliensis]|uniref:LysR family transcriptional regulator n=1 Tax=Arabiibacter massiliensis TaxID=1870985 RepID=UPI0009BC2268|nr:LysR family transcriptional regulator [Arabiibacter massiliensis]
MHISYLKEFVELVYCLNYSEASRNLNTAQSTLSKHVLALERECGAELLVRSSAQVRLTQEGQALFEGALDIIDAHDRTLERIAELKKDPPITVGGLYRNPHLVRIVNAILNRQRENGSPLGVRYDNSRQRPFVELVENGTLDVAFTMMEHGAEPPEGLAALHLFDDPLVAIMMKDHPLADRASLQVGDLDKQKLLSPDGVYAIAGAKIARKLFASKGAQPIYRPVFLQSVQDFPTLDIADNLLVVERSLQQQQPLTDDHRVLPFDDEDACFPFYAVYRQEPRSQAIARFVEELEEEARRFREGR